MKGSLVSVEAGGGVMEIDGEAANWADNWASWLLSWVTCGASVWSSEMASWMLLSRRLIAAPWEERAHYNDERAPGSMLARIFLRVLLKISWVVMDKQELQTGRKLRSLRRKGRRTTIRRSNLNKFQISIHKQRNVTWRLRWIFFQLLHVSS